MRYLYFFLESIGYVDIELVDYFLFKVYLPKEKKILTVKFEEQKELD